MLMRSLSAVLWVTLLAGTGKAEDLPPSAATSETPAHLTLKVILVGDDLTLKPVPKKKFVVCREPECAEPEEVVTSFQGEAVLTIPAGVFRIKSVEPVPFSGKLYGWNMTVTLSPGDQKVLELSNDNALTAEISPQLGIRVPTDEGILYRRYRTGVVKIISERGHGSGFLVDPEGLILTNHHVVAESGYLAAKVSETGRYPIQLVVEDATNDVAVVRINPRAVEGAAVLPLAEDVPDRPPVEIGERVVAIGSPLTTETILTSGLVSKVEQGAIFSDVNINPGNSGGPLLDQSGRVIGICTFGLGPGRGPGVSGIIRIHLASGLVAQAREKIEGTQPPPDRRLPEESSYRFPAATLIETARSIEDPDPTAYHVEMGPMDIQFITPPIVTALQVQTEKEQAATQKKRTKGKGGEYVPGKDFYEWRRYAGDYRPVVTVQAIPEVGLTGASIFAAVMLGANAPQEFRFKSDFKKMELLRDGVVVEPLWPGRIPNAVSTTQGNAFMKDMTYYGAYEYPPEAFRPGGAVQLKVWEEKRDEPRIKALPESTLSLIWRDFEPYFKSLQSTLSSEPDRVDTPRPKEQHE